MAATPEAITRRETRGSARLWFGLLGAPAAWAIALLVGYSLEEWFACSPAATEPGTVLGVDVGAAGLGIAIAMLLVAIASGLVAWSCLVRIPADGEASVQRARWMAIAGIMNSVLYGLAIVTSMFAPVLLNVCETTP